MTIRGDKRKTAQQRTEARWSVKIDREEGYREHRLKIRFILIYYIILVIFYK